MSSVMTDWVTVSSFFLFYVYFLCGHLFCSRIFAFSTRIARRPVATLIGLVIWAIIEEAAVKLKLTEIPGATLIFGLAGALAIVSLSSLLAKTRLFQWLSYCGRNSLVIYLSFFLPMAATRILLLRSGVVSDVGWMSLIVAATAIASPLVLNRLVAGTVIGFLFKRPLWARLEPDSVSAAITSYTVAERADMQYEEIGKEIVIRSTE